MISPKSIQKIITTLPFYFFSESIMRVQKVFLKLRVPAGWFFFILTATIGTLHSLSPLWLIFAGLLIRTLAAGVIKKNSVLATSGIYSLVRHPLYLGSLLIVLGFILATKNPWLIGYFLIFFPATYLTAIRSEEAFLFQKFGEDFILYQKRVPAFIPAIKKVAQWAFSFSHAIFNGEGINWAIIIGCILFLLLKSRIFCC